ncbi:MAG: hypothetical protein BGO34_10880 [Bacteroidia bacterium 44-10]|jgi:hypothetical protein|nr:MAG: hypothetical protein BGO34_10880 [Bacteroidia bacterium 44-10]
MNKLLIYISTLLFLSHIPVYGQVNLGWQGGSDYLTVGSYSGAVSQSDIAKLKISGNGNITFENWKVSARIVNYPVMNGGNEFPADKVSFSPTGTSGNLKPGPIPSVSQIGMPLSVSFQNGPNEVFLVPNSNAPIVNNSATPNDYFELIMGFNLTIAPGSYLNALQAWKEYQFQIEYTLYDGNNTPIARIQHMFKIQVANLGPPPEENQYTIRISTEASNGLLEFNTMADYINGKSVTYTNGLSVSATTAYQVTVRSVTSSFSSAAGNTLPLDVVRLQLNGDSGTRYIRPLSTATQTILEGASTGGNAVNFDIIYSTEANDSRLFNISPDQYETSLMYEISPR